MKKWITIIPVVLLIGLLTSTTVFADLMYWDASLEDDFYKRHEKRIEKTSGCITYTTCGPEGKVKVYKSPQNKHVVKEIRNGLSIVPTDIFTDVFGEKWAECLVNDLKVKGWVPMVYLIRDYDFDLFSEDYRSDITNEENISFASEEEKVIIYAFPGSEKIRRTCTGEVITCQKSFHDEKGRKWGGSEDEFGWICLNSPGASFDELYPDGAIERDTRVLPEGFPDSSREVVPRELPLDDTVLAAGGVVIVIILAGGLLIMIRRIQKKQNGVRR